MSLVAFSKLLSKSLLWTFTSGKALHVFQHSRDIFSNITTLKKKKKSHYLSIITPFRNILCMSSSEYSSLMAALHYLKFQTLIFVSITL